MKKGIVAIAVIAAAVLGFIIFFKKENLDKHFPL